MVDYNTLSGPRSDVLTGTYSYDGANRLTGIAYTSDADANTIDTLGWTYDDASNVATFSSIDGTATYGYDPTNQLTSASYTTSSGGHQPANESFSFDANGNRNSTGYSTTSPNLMSSDGTYNYQYDADGNMTSRTQIASTYSTQYKTTFTWDYRNRLTDVEYYDNNNVLTEHVHYVYDVFDNLLATEVDTTGDGTFNEITHYVLDVSPQIPAAGLPGTTPSQPVFDFDGNGNLIERNLVAPNPAGVDAVLVQGAVSSLSQGDTDTFAADDDVGTPHDIVSSSGAVLNHIVDSVFGEIAYQSDSSVTWWAGFGGGHDDSITGLVNNYERWYNPTTGTWLSPDPSGFSAGDPNLVRYVGNSPTDAFDATGLAIQTSVYVMLVGGSVPESMAGTHQTVYQEGGVTYTSTWSVNAVQQIPIVSNYAYVNPSIRQQMQIDLGGHWTIPTPGRRGLDPRIEESRRIYEQRRWRSRWGIYIGGSNMGEGNQINVGIGRGRPFDEGPFNEPDDYPWWRRGLRRGFGPGPEER